MQLASNGNELIAALEETKVSWPPISFAADRTCKVFGISIYMLVYFSRRTAVCSQLIDNVALFYWH